MSTRLPKGIVARNMNERCEKAVAHRPRSAGKPGEGVVGGRARGELAMADG